MEKEKLKGHQKILLLTALILATMAPVGDMVIIPAADAMFGHFADANISILNFILSGPSLIALVTALIAGKLMAMEVIRKKQLLLIALCLFAIGSCFGIAIETPMYMAGMRCIVGAAVGIVSPCCMAILSDTFSDEKELGFMIGIWNAGMAIVGAVIGVVAGIVATGRWENVFRLYLAAIPIILIAIVAIPGKTPVEKSRAAATDISGDAGPGHKDAMPWGKVGLSLLGYLVGSMIICVMYYQISMYVAETGIGNAALGGTLSTVLTIGTFIASLIFGFLFGNMKKFLPFIIFGCAAISYALFAFVPSVPGAAVAMALDGIANGLIMSYYQSYLATLVPQNQSAFVLSLSSSVLGLGMFLATYLNTLLQSIGNGTIIQVCFILTIASAVLAVLALLLHIKDE